MLWGVVVFADCGVWGVGYDAVDLGCWWTGFVARSFVCSFVRSLLADFLGWYLWMGLLLLYLCLILYLTQIAVGLCV